MADKIYEAYKMDPKLRQQKMRRLRKIIRDNDIFKWAETFIRVATSEDLQISPPQEDFVPKFGIG